MSALRYYLTGRKRVWAHLSERTYDLRGTPLTLRGPLGNEVPSIVHMIERAFEEERQHKQTPKLSPDFIAYMSSDEVRLNTYVMLLEGQIIGFGMVDMVGNSLRLQRELMIKYIYIAPEHRSLLTVGQTVDYIKDIARQHGCAQVNWSFDTGKDVARKIKLAQRLGFEPVHDTFILPLPDGSPDDLPIPDTTKPSLATLRRYGGYFRGGRMSFAIFALIYPLFFRRNVRNGKRFLEVSSQRSYMFAMLQMDAETFTHHCLVEACHAPGPSEIATLTRWAQGHGCTHILIDTGQTGPLDPATANALPALGFEPFGSSFRYLV